MKIYKVVFLTILLFSFSFVVKAQTDYGCKISVFVQDSFGNEIKNAKIEHFDRELFYSESFKAYTTIRLFLLSEIKQKSGTDVGKLKIKAKGFETFNKDVTFWCDTNYLLVTLKNKSSDKTAKVEYLNFLMLIGKVTDEKGAFMPNALINFKNTNGTVYKTKSNEQGDYAVELQAGNYKIEATYGSGEKCKMTNREKEITISKNKPNRQDIKLFLKYDNESECFSHHQIINNE